MKKTLIIISIIILVAIAVAVWFSSVRRGTKDNGGAVTSSAADSQNNNVGETNFGNTVAENTTTSTPEPEQNAPENAVNAKMFVPALEQAAERVTEKPFGIYITLADSPVQPERFQGYHTGVDFEILVGEENAEVVVMAVCAGKLVYKNYVSGYGGVAAELCELEGQPIIVIYGHLKLGSITNKINDELNAGDKIGVLGKGYSAETDGERQHLHLGFVKGEAVNLKGYVSTKSKLDDWIDPCEYVCGK